MISLKSIGKSILCAILEKQVVRLRSKYDFKVIAVAGSLGKTSTKYAIAQLLAQNMRVRYQAGNYNDRSTVPLVFFGESQPALFNVYAWAQIIARASKQIRQEYPYDVVVVELGSDGPGQIEQFEYIQPDISVVTAVTEEHMEYFKELDAVAKEELGITRFSKQSVINVDDTPANYLLDKEYVSYGLVPDKSDYFVNKRTDRGLAGQILDVKLPSGALELETVLVGKQGAITALAAVTVGDLLGLSREKLQLSLPKVLPYAGRMQILAGQKSAVLIDDTYNAAPKSFKAALDVLYAANATQRIAILGSINEMGDLSEAMHQEVGEYCDPTKLNLVVTIGRDAERWLAPIAKAKGCTVVSFSSPYQAGNYVLTQMQTGAVVLAKGSQNGVFAEEALKQLLEKPADNEKLVRQSDYWMAIKEKQFKDAL
jgi:UDP-N-acetylmuramoyl-tripeptide--D-alanyl-D-alanine ligase